MSRFRRVVHSVASGYAVLAVTAVYSLASLPLAMHYLSTDTFGLWTLMAGISGYLGLIDLGMSSSVSRLLIDHKDDRSTGVYGSLIKTGWLVLCTQGLLVFAAAWALSQPLCMLLEIPAGLRSDFVVLMRWQGLLLALNFVFRIFNHILQAQQRIDLVNYSQILTLVLNLGLLWWFFDKGGGVLSMVWAALLSTLCAAVVLVFACLYLRLFPRSGAWGKATWGLFTELFGYGKDVFLVSLGTQFIMASQSMILTRQLGLSTAAAWYAGTRAFNFVSQALWRISDVSMPAFAEMMVRGEKQLLAERYRAMVMVTASAAGFAAVVFAVCNGPFVAILTHGSVKWAPANDVLLGLWMLVLAILHCHSTFVLVTKKIGLMRYVYFLEGIAFVIAALFATKIGGLSAMIACSLVASLLFSGTYGVWRISRYFEWHIWSVGIGWLAPMARMLSVFAPVALCAWWTSQFVASPLVRFSLLGALSGCTGAYFLLRYGLSEAFQQEILERAPRIVNPALRCIFLSAAAKSKG